MSSNSHILLLCSAFVLCVVIYVRSKIKRRNFPPGPWGFPIIGHLPILGLEPHKKALEWMPKYGPIVGLDFGSFQCIIISDYKLVKEAGAIPAFNGRPKLQYAFDRSGGTVEGIILTEGQTWREQRAFTHRRLRDLGGFGTRSMENAIVDQVDELVQKLHLDAGRPISTRVRFNITVVNALWSIISGTPFKLDDSEVQRLTNLVAEALESSHPAAAICMFVPGFGIFPDWITHKQDLEGQYKPINDFLKPYLEERHAAHVEGKPRDLIDAYINEIKSTTDPDSSFYSSRGKQSLATTLLDLLLAGTHSASTTLEWVCLILARFTGVQDRVAAEIADVIGGCRPSLEYRNLMPYTEAMIHEVMRFRTLVPLGSFHSTTEQVRFHGFDIPKDTMVFFNAYAAHTDKAIWGDPEEFRPERWLNEDGTEFIRREGFMSFGTGKRVCLGEALARDELFLFTVGLFQSFCICIDPNGPIPTLEPKVGGSTVTPKPHNLIFNLRENM